MCILSATFSLNRALGSFPASSPFLSRSPCYTEKEPVNPDLFTGELNVKLRTSNVGTETESGLFFVLI